MKFIDFIDKFEDTGNIVLDIPVEDRTEGVSIEIAGTPLNSHKVLKSALKMNFKNHIVENFFIEDGELRINLDLEDKERIKMCLEKDDPVYYKKKMIDLLKTATENGVLVSCGNISNDENQLAISFSNNIGENVAVIIKAY